METLLSYSLTDLLMFSPQSYARLFERYNQALWPAHLPVALLTLWLLTAVHQGDALRARLVALLLALAWGAIAWFFFFHHYAVIHIAAPWFGYGFAVQALLLLVFGTLAGHLPFGGPRSAGGSAGVVVLLIALIGLPLLNLLNGRPWQGIELFGLAPDPTALGTLGLLLMTAGKTRWLLLPLPLLWCAITLLTQLAMVLKG